MKYRYRVLLLFVSVTLLTNALSAGLMYVLFKKMLFREIQNKVLSIATTASTLVDGNLHKSLRTRRDEQRPEYQQLVKQMRRVRDVNRRSDTYIKYVYSMYYTPKAKHCFQFGVDAEESEKDKSHIGDEYKSPAGDVVNPLEPQVNRHFITDQWGTWLSAMSPIKDPSGKFVAGLGVDMAASKILHEIHRVLVLGVLIFGLSGLLSLTVAHFLADYLSKPLRALQDGTRVVGDGNLDYRLKIQTNDEFEALADSFNKMTIDLQAYIRDLRETTAAKERIESEIQIARSIQMSLVPKTFPPFPDRKDFEIHACLEPAREIGGDFYDFWLIDEEHLALVIGDVSGKGVPAALFMAVTRTFVKALSREELNPALLMKKLNTQLAQDNESSMFVSLFCAVIHLPSGVCRYASGGHNEPFLRLAKGKVQVVPKFKGMLVGAMEGLDYEEGRFDLKCGDLLFLYTDGVTEAMNHEDKQYGEERAGNCLASLGHGNAEEVIKGMRENLQQFVNGAEQSDDITMLVFRYLQDDSET